MAIKAKSPKKEVPAQAASKQSKAAEVPAPVEAKKQSVHKDKPKAKIVATHPKYIDMIKEAVKELKERNGSSRQAITKFIDTKYKVGETGDHRIKLELVKGVKNGALKQVSGTGASGSFRLGADKKQETAKASSAVTAAPKSEKLPKKPKAKAEKTKAAATKTASAAPMAKTPKPIAKKSKTETEKPSTKADKVAKPKSAAAPKPKAAKVAKSSPKAVEKTAKAAKPKTSKPKKDAAPKPKS